MKKISLDNGATWLDLKDPDVETVQEVLDGWIDIEAAMDDDTREAVHRDADWYWTELDFLVAYLEKAPEDLIIG